MHEQSPKTGRQAGRLQGLPLAEVSIDATSSFLERGKGYTMGNLD